MRKRSLQELNRLSVAAFKEATKLPLVVVLDNIRSGLNVGAVFRTADAFALDAVYLCGITSQPPHREILKTAIGATQSVEWHYVAQTTDCIVQLKQKGYKIVGIEQTDASVPLQQAPVQATQAYALVLGNEVKGLDEVVLPHLDMCIEVPQFGTKHSLNVSVCTGIVLWEFVKKMKFQNM